MSPSRIPGRRIVFAAVGFLLGASLRAATYQAGPDTGLARRAPVIVRASVVSKEVRLENAGGRVRPVTLVTLSTLETIRGRVPDTFSVRLPGGRVGDTVAWIPGTPRFREGAEVVLLLERAAGLPGVYRLTEFGLSKFDLVADDEGRSFAVRSALGPREDLLVADRGDVLASLSEKSAVPARDAESFLSALRAIGSGRMPGDIVWREPASKDEPGRRPKWVNIGGREPGDCDLDGPCLFRWFWDSGASVGGVVTVAGAQTNLTADDLAGCGTDSLCDVQNAIDGWTGIADTRVDYSGPAAAGNVTVTLDAVEDFNGGDVWSTALGCGQGVIGLGGPTDAQGPRSYRGDGDFLATRIADVSMRKITCVSGYSARTFKTAVMHELGHTLGLGHPDKDVSTHSTTPSSAWSGAVMHSSIAMLKPEAPEPDDVQGIQYLYATGSLGTPPSAAFTFAPPAPVSGVPVEFNDGSAGGATVWTWDFGDPASGSSNASTLRNPKHTFRFPGTYTVRLAAASPTGTGATTRSVAVAPGAVSACAPSPTTLCLNNDRFAVSAAYRTSQSSGDGTGTELTVDSGYFTFFNAENIEVVVKVLNACGLQPSRYWVFAAGLTNVEVTLRVTDTQDGSVETYVNPQGTPFAPVQDTSAFSSCP